MLKTLIGTALAAATIATTTVATAPQADAATTNHCAIVRSNTVGGFNWSRIPTARVCSPTLSYGVSGQAFLVEKKVVINYSSRRTSATEVSKATVHELSHQVEYRTTAAHRAKLYRFLGLKNPTGNYFAYNDAYYYSGPLTLWKQSPRERLAESVVNCRFGAPNHTGLKMVPRTQCGAFLTEFKASLAAAR